MKREKFKRDLLWPMKKETNFFFVVSQNVFATNENVFALICGKNDGSTMMKRGNQLSSSVATSSDLSN